MAGFYNPYMIQGNYMTELQNMRDRIDNQIQQVAQQQQSMQQMPMQQPSINQTFQLSPTNGNNNFKIVNTIEDVQKEIVLADTYFLSKDNSQMWIKNTRGDIRTFTIEEIIPKDEKDLLIEDLQRQINELKGGKSNAVTQYNESNGFKFNEQSITGDVNQFGKPITENESSNVSDVSNGKTTKRKP